MTPLHRTIRIARPLSHLTTLALVAYPAALIAMAANGAYTEDQLRSTFADVSIQGAITPVVWGLLAAISGVAVALNLAVLWTMRRLLRLYGDGAVLGQEAAHCIRRIGGLLLVLALWGFLSTTLEIVVLTWNNPPGSRSFTVGVSSTDVFLILAAGLMTVIGWAMAEAAEVAAENREFV